MFPSRSSPVTPSLLIWTPAALAEHVAAQFQDQERLLEEARRDLKETKRDLALHKEALSNSKRDRRDLEERFEHERQVLGDEIRQLGESVAHAYEEGPRQGKKALDDGILKLKVSPLLYLIDIVIAFFECPLYESFLHMI